MASEATKVDDGGAAVAMSLRDHFAGQAMCGILADPSTRRGRFGWPEDYDEFCEAVADSSYSHADAMLAARKAGAQ
jgi:hypothetical protein